MRSAGRLKLGYFPLPIEEAHNIRGLLVPLAPYAAIDPCVGDGTALLEISKDSGACLASIELDAERAAAAAESGIATVHGSAFECRGAGRNLLTSLSEPAHDCEFGPHSNKRMELVFLEHCYRWVTSEGVLVFVVRAPAVGTCARLLAAQFDRLCVFRLGHPKSLRFNQVVVFGRLGNLVLGVIWAVWHLPLFFIPLRGVGAIPWLAFPLLTTGCSGLFSWLREVSGRRTFSAIYAHALLNGFGSVFPTIGPTAPQVRYWL